MAAHLPEIREADAPDDVAALYSAIKIATGVPQVNLIWRHFATDPPVLNWAWATLAPLLSSGELVAAADRLFTSIAHDGDPAPVWLRADGDVAHDVRDVMAFYNWGNCQNLIALSALIHFANTAGADTCEPVSSAPPSDARHTDVRPDLKTVPALPRLDALAPDLRHRVEALAARHHGAAPGVVPSMYLHLALWPDALVRADDQLAGFVGQPKFLAQVDAVMSEKDRFALALVDCLDRTVERPEAERLNTKLATLDRFVRTTIPQMVVVGRALSGGRELAQLA